jgi:hypothetical protein
MNPQPLSEASEKDLSLPQDPKAGALTKQRNADRKGHATQQVGIGGGRGVTSELGSLT